MELRHDSAQCQRSALLQVWLPKVTGSGFPYTRAMAIFRMPHMKSHTHTFMKHTVPGQINDVYTNCFLITGSTHDRPGRDRFSK